MSLEQDLHKFLPSQQQGDVAFDSLLSHIGTLFDEISTAIDTTKYYSDFRKIPSNQLDNYAETYGFHFPRNLSDTTKRLLLRDIIKIHQTNGTERSLRFLFNIVGLNIRIDYIWSLNPHTDNILAYENANPFIFYDTPSFDDFRDGYVDSSVTGEQYVSRLIDMSRVNDFLGATASWNTTQGISSVSVAQCDALFENFDSIIQHWSLTNDMTTKNQNNQMVMYTLSDGNKKQYGNLLSKDFSSFKRISINSDIGTQQDDFGVLVCGVYFRSDSTTQEYQALVKQYTSDSNYSVITQSFTYTDFDSKWNIEVNTDDTIDFYVGSKEIFSGLPRTEDIIGFWYNGVSGRAVTANSLYVGYSVNDFSWQPITNTGDKITLFNDSENILNKALLVRKTLTSANAYNPNTNSVYTQSVQPGLNTWHIRRFRKNSSDPASSFVPLATVEQRSMIDSLFTSDGSTIYHNSNTDYLGIAETTVTTSAATSLSLTFGHDDGAGVYLNGTLITSNNTSNASESATLPLVSGTNHITFVWNKGNTGLGGIYNVSPVLGTATNVTQLDSYFALNTGDIWIDTSQTPNTVNSYSSQAWSAWTNNEITLNFKGTGKYYEDGRYVSLIDATNVTYDKVGIIGENYPVAHHHTNYQAAKTPYIRITVTKEDYNLFTADYIDPNTGKVYSYTDTERYKITQEVINYFMNEGRPANVVITDISTPFELTDKFANYVTDYNFNITTKDAGWVYDGTVNYGMDTDRYILGENFSGFNFGNSNITLNQNPPNVTVNRTYPIGASGLQYYIPTRIDATLQVTVPSDASVRVYKSDTDRVNLSKGNFTTKILGTASPGTHTFDVKDAFAAMINIVTPSSTGTIDVTVTEK